MKIIQSIFLIIFCLKIFAQTTISDTISSGGILRDYRLYIPAIYNPANPVPLVFNLHGYTSNNVAQEFYGDFRPIADTANFIIVHPNGTKDGFGNRFWNTFDGSTVDDVGFISNLIDSIKANYSIDENRIYSTGMSNGGFMSYELACQLSERITAIASVTGSMLLSHKNLCNAIHPTPVMEIHGTADATVPYNGTSSFIHIDSLVKFWVQFNNCSTTPIFTSVPDIDNTDNCTAENYLFNGGNQNSEVELYKIIGGEHTWPGSSFNTTVTNMDFSASEKIWQFFSQYKLNELTSGIENKMVEKSVFSVFPNPSSSAFISYELKSVSDVTLEMYDLLGRKIKTLVNERQSKGKYEYGISERDFAANEGMYFIILTENGKIHSRKFISQK